MSGEVEYSDPSPVFDTLDVDLIIKVLKNTAFSPFFCMLIPTFYLFQGAKATDSIVVISAAYCLAVSAFWFIQWCSLLYHNQGSFWYAPKPMEWSDQIVVVTGGSSGIGELLANTLAVKSVTVIVLDVKPIQSQNYNINYYKCDVSKWEEVEAVSKKIVEEIGEPTILINNAGVVQGKLLLDLSPEDLKQTFDVNTLAHFWTLKAFLPAMIAAGKGHIAMLGMRGFAQMSDYCASKAALISLHSYKAPGVRTTLLCPGHVHTPLFAGADPANKFFFPTVHPIEVVKKVIQALDDTHSQSIYLPFYVNFVPTLQLLPEFVGNLADWLTNANFAMKNFRKPSSRRDEEGPVTKAD
ncbi:unnamed protein product [Mycena citricolor]|uniref:Retinal short-chain dehydrogenase/reductase n=1 Tax=Mycena citricolor TaxID=2018698 RepID=A0AAD2HEQ9_9AGAR|nr:unnamed protein product [Mycena citricolor]